MDFIKDFKVYFYRKRGTNFLNKGKTKKALYYYEKLIFISQKIEDYYQLALCHMALRDFYKAENFLKKVIGEFPHNEIALFTTFEAKLMQRKWEEATEIIEKLLTIKPNSSSYKTKSELLKDVIFRDKYVLAKEKLYKAEDLKSENKFEEALNILIEALNLDNKNPYIFNNIGSIMLQLKKPLNEAYPYFEKAAVLDPNNKQFQDNLDELKRKL